MQLRSTDVSPEAIGDAVFAAFRQTADDLDRALAGDHDGAWSFEAEDGRYTVALGRIVFVKRYARESRVGFGASG